MPRLFNQRSFLCFASQTRAENFPNHHFLSKTVGPSPNLRGAGVGCCKGQHQEVLRQCRALLEQVQDEAWSQQFTVLSNAVRIHSCVLTSFHNLMPTWEPFSGTASTEPPKQCKAFNSAHLAKLRQTQPLWAHRQSSPLSAGSFPLHARQKHFHWPAGERYLLKQNMFRFCVTSVRTFLPLETTQKNCFENC